MAKQRLLGHVVYKNKMALKFISNIKSSIKVGSIFKFSFYETQNLLWTNNIITDVIFFVLWKPCNQSVGTL